ncbi:uncharacterized protein LOC110862886 [Folsomia candida]|uniref:Mite group 2 allergen Lep d 2 n=1 Tax=Folsomia candida TaxID=158441 RepID=A0A226CW56_FOLCA|nr:uncharacterized protein LOC110862886 [Folsomia candida]OXA36747.1 Mite group 2 allergen Lep d 2 [Folsomia candida]
MKGFAIFALCIVAASAGVVTHEGCGGAGQVSQVRISDCEGAVAEMRQGVEYSVEADVIPAAASAGLYLKVTVVFMGNTIPIIDAVVPNSAVQPGTLYTLRWTITPGAIPVGNTVPVTSEISDAASAAVLMCARITARII